MELIEHLDQKKDEAIERTFKGIAKHFSTVFSELVPKGKGMLVIQTKKVRPETGRGKKRKASRESDLSEDEMSDNDAEISGVQRHYSGIGIKVSFTGQSASDQSMTLFSGGQQSVVALSLIFAIQRCDPSPFYLFDEIDSALDAQYRTAVARMIENQSKTTQFICTTFRPEMLAVADKFYGVSFVNKTSRVATISNEEAQQLVVVFEKEASTGSSASSR